MPSIFQLRKRLDTRMNLRLQKYTTGIRGFFARSADLEHTSEESFTEEGTKELGEVRTVEVASVVQVKEQEPIDNLEVWKDRFPKRGLSKWKQRWARLMRFVKLIIAAYMSNLPIGKRLDMLKMGREFNSIELNEIREQAEQEKLALFHKEGLKRAEKTIINTLDNLGYCTRHINEKNGRARTIKHVTFDRLEYNEQMYRFHVNAADLPYKVNLLDLCKPEVTTTCAASLGHPVNAKLGDSAAVDNTDSTYMGLWFEVEIAGTLGIPNRCEFRKMLELIPESAHDLAFTLGYAENKRHVVRSLEPLPHLLITGETLGGKSNGTNVIICCHISRNSPDELRTLMIDVKGGGIELGHYEGIAHMITEVPGVQNGIARTSEQGLVVLEWVAAESEARMERMTEKKIKKLSQWNKKYPRRKLPYIVVYIDEVAELLDPQDRKLRNAVLSLIKKLASTSRAAGVHLVGALQTADRTNMPQTIKNNFPGRLAFAMSDASASILAIGNGDAMNLSPVGRSIWKHGRDRVTVQTPFISNGEIEQVVNAAKEGKVITKIKRTKVTPEEIIRWSLNEAESRLPFRETFAQFNARGMSKGDLDGMLREMDGMVYIVDDEAYKVLPGAGTTPRRIEKLDDPSSVRQNRQDSTQDTTQNEESEEE